MNFYLTAQHTNGIIRIVMKRNTQTGAGETAAQLIAAAPEMLESLRELAFFAESVAHLRGMEKDVLPMTDKARAVIAKATGAAA